MCNDLKFIVHEYLIICPLVPQNTLNKKLIKWEPPLLGLSVFYWQGISTVNMNNFGGLAIIRLETSINIILNLTKHKVVLTIFFYYIFLNK